MVTPYSQKFFIFTRYPGDLLIRLQGNISKFIGICAQEILITTHMHVKNTEVIYDVITRDKTEYSSHAIAEVVDVKIGMSGY